MQAIAKTKSPFASRADDSGTNAKELKLWQQAGVTPSGSWYIKTGQGMGPTLVIADQKNAYTLSDRGTFLATKNLDSKILVQGDPQLQQPLPRDRGQAPGHQRRLRQGLLGLDYQRAHAEADRPVRQAPVRPGAVPSRRRGAVSPPSATLLWELVARSAVVSLSATAIAMAIGIPAGTALGAAALPRTAIGGHRRQHGDGAAHGRRRLGRGPRALSAAAHWDR